MISTQSTSIYNYNQIYDYLRTIKFNDYLINKRDIIHNILYENAVNEFIQYINDCINNVRYIPNKELDAVIDKLLSVNIEANEKGNILDEDRFKFIEYKDNVWYKPSKVTIIYTGGLVKEKYNISDKNGNKSEYEKYTKLNIGPVSLELFWKTEYIVKENYNNLLELKNSNYSIKSVDYINGTVDLFDKNEFTTITISLDYIDNLNNYTFYENYPEMFSIKRNKPII